MEPVWVLARILVYPMRLLFRVRFSGRKRIPHDGPVLIAANHVSFLDPLLLLWLGERRLRKARFLAKAELWNIPLLRFFLVRTKQIPVPRASAAAAGSLTAAAESLRNDQMVCIYPEGTISRDLEPMPGKTGIARLAATTGVPVTPVGLWGFHRVWTIGRRPSPRPWVCGCIVVGEPVHVGPDDDLFDATDRIMEGVVDCVQTARRIYPQRPWFGRKAWWVRAPESAVLRPTPRTSSDSRWG